MLTLSLCDDKNRNNIKALYACNTPGARKIILPYDYIVKLFIFHSKEQQERFIKEEIKNMANRARALGKNDISLESKIRKILYKIIQEKHSQLFKDVYFCPLQILGFLYNRQKSSLNKHISAVNYLSNMYKYLKLNIFNCVAL